MRVDGTQTIISRRDLASATPIVVRVTSGYPKQTLPCSFNLPPKSRPSPSRPRMLNTNHVDPKFCARTSDSNLRNSHIASGMFLLLALKPQPLSMIIKKLYFILSDTVWLRAKRRLIICIARCNRHRFLHYIALKPATYHW